MEQNEMALTFNPDTYTQFDGRDGGQFEGSVVADDVDIRVCCDTLDELNGVRRLIAAAPGMFAALESLEDMRCVRGPRGYCLSVPTEKMEEIRAAVAQAKLSDRAQD